MYSVTIFKSLFDNKTDKRVDLKDWSAFEKMLYDLSKMPGYKAKRGENKKSSPLMSPAIYHPDTTRANKNVIEWSGWAAVLPQADDGEDAARAAGRWCAVARE